MKPKEFYEIMESFVKEDKRWRALKIGDIVYEEQPGGLLMDYFKMKIKKIDIEERKILAHDVEGNHISTLSYFLTQEEFNKLK